MIDLTSEIISTLKANDFGIDIPSENITDGYTTSKPTFTKPRIVVSEVTNIPDLNTYTNKEEYSSVAYQIDIYCKAGKLDGKITSNTNVARTLSHRIYDLLNDKFGLMRVGIQPTVPYTQDSTVMRKIITVGGTIDLTHKYIYR